MYWEHEGNRAVRFGEWKLVAKGAVGPWELYDLAADRTELHDLAAAEPERVAELAARWQAWAERCNVLPLNPRKEPAFSKRTRFELDNGASLERTAAPHVLGKGIRFDAVVESNGENGVLIAQGGGADGWAVYLQDRRLRLATRHGGRLTTIAAAAPFPNGAVRVRAIVARDGRLTLSVGGRIVAKGRAPSALIKMPIDGLQVGRDDKGSVGEYRAPFRFDGAIRSAVVEIR